MDIQTLRGLLDQIQADLENVGGDKHVKAASQRVRTNLGKIKNATPAIRKTLVEMDKN